MDAKAERQPSSTTQQEAPVPAPEHLPPGAGFLLKVGAWLVVASTVLGCAMLLIEAFWITYGVFTRYVLSNPDRMVTEGTALILLALAFAGLPSALRQNSFPRVAFLIDRLSPTGALVVGLINTSLIAFVGMFLTMSAGTAALRTFGTQQTMYITGWYEYVFWIPVAIFTLFLTMYAVILIYINLYKLTLVVLGRGTN